MKQGREGDLLSQQIDRSSQTKRKQIRAHKPTKADQKPTERDTRHWGSARRTGKAGHMAYAYAGVTNIVGRASSGREEAHSTYSTCIPAEDNRMTEVGEPLQLSYSQVTKEAAGWADAE